MNAQKTFQRDGIVDFVKIEHKILKFWEEYQCFEKLRKKNRKGPIFKFLDGPITANNPMGVHHAWGRTLKDVFIRYKSLQGYKCNWQNGFDSQGLWVEVEVERELGFTSKQDIEDFGLENFIQKCKDRVKKYSQKQTEQSIRLGQWMDWENSYYTNTDSNIQGIWFFLKKCHENGWIYQGHKLSSWCPRCGTSLSEHEMTGSYRMIEHPSVFVKLPLIEKNTRILVWTTTPWTLAANVALAVKRDIDYCEVSIANEKEPLILARDSLNLLHDYRPKILRTFKGAELAGLRYETCFPELAVQQGFEHKIVPWEMVDPAEGTGVVHIAPGCGAEDYELGQIYNLSIIQPIDESGNYVQGFDWLTGNNVQNVAEMVIENLQNSGKLFKSYLHSHSYPVCWRCKTEIVFRLVKEWFLNVNEIRPRMLEAAGKVLWQPEYTGKHMEDWLHNMGDWNISRKRFYGLPLPFYPCDNCGTLSVVGSKDELNKLSAQDAHDIPELHRPWIDDIQIKCPNCGSVVSRVPDVGDVWLDAGIVPFTTLNYFEDRESWKEYFPVEWIAEMREQVRLWFYSMLFMGVTLEHRSPYERVLAYESVVSEEGTRFSKTGYMIQFDKAVEKVGADTMRYLFCGANITNNVRFGYGLGFEIQRRLLSFWNAYLFFKTYASLDRPEIADFIPSVDNLTVTDKWLITRTNTFLETVSNSFDEYLTPHVIKEFEAFVDDLSNWYIRINRRRFWKSEDSQDKKIAYWCLYNALCMATQVMAPIIPYMTEEIWQNAIRLINSKAPISVHLSQWPEPLMNLKDDEILEQTAVVRNIISLALRLRNQEQIKVRQPLLSMFIIVDESKQEAVEKMKEILMNEINVKSIHFLKNLNTVESPLIKLDFQKAGPVLKKDLQNVNELLNGLSEQQKFDIAEQYESGDSINIPGWQEPLPATLFVREFQPKEGIVVLTEGEIVLALDTKIPDYLKLEGFVRELVRKIQVFRKDSGLRVEQRISIGIQTSSQELQKAVLTHKEYIAEETLAENINFDLENPLFKKNLKISNYQVEISIAPL